MQKSYEESKASLEKMKKERDAARKDVENMKQLDQSRKEVTELGKALVWGAEKTCTKLVEEIRNKLALGPSLIEKAEANLQKAREDVEAHTKLIQGQVRTQFMCEAR